MNEDAGGSTYHDDHSYTTQNFNNLKTDNKDHNVLHSSGYSNRTYDVKNDNRFVPFLNT